MNENTDIIKETEAAHPYGNYRTYIVGFLLSIGLTLLSFFLVFIRLFTGWPLILTIALLALIQAGVQLRFFLHVGEESKPQWNFLSFLFMLLTIFILVAGSLWIMYNLMERTMPMG